jgi:hypothetical protein
LKSRFCEKIFSFTGAAFFILGGLVPTLPLTAAQKNHYDSPILGRRQAVRHWILIPAFPGSNPGAPTVFEIPTPSS